MRSPAAADRYAEYEPDFYIPLVYMYATGATTALNLKFGLGRFRLRSRVRFGYAAFLLALGLVPIIEESRRRGGMSTGTAYGLMLTTVLMVAVGGGVQQSSLYGLAGMLPRKYTLAVMIGESVAGVTVSLSRILTKLAFPTKPPSEVPTATYLFFGLSMAFIGLCAILFELADRGRLIRYYSARFSAPLAHRPGDDPFAGVPPLAEGESSTDEELKGRDSAHVQRATVFPLIRLPMLTVAGSFAVTLLLFPGVATLVDPSFGDWFPIYMIFTFNVGDLIGKLLPFAPAAGLQPAWWCDRPKALFKFVAARTVLIPFMVLCVAPVESPVFGGQAVPILVILIVGVTGGYTGTVSVAAGSASVAEELRETAGTMMTVALLCGLITGTTLAVPFAYLGNSTAPVG